MEQNVIKVKCPHCGAIITIQNATGVADKMLKCPNCNYRDKVSVFIAEINKPMDDDTEACITASEDCIGSLKVGDKLYPLAEGKNTIGRKSVSSVADVQLDVEDRRMSRMHICITVVKKTNGVQHRIENLTMQGKVIINGNTMKAGEVVILQFGDVIRLGETDIQFVR